jgi:hypothetical protein
MATIDVNVGDLELDNDDLEQIFENNRWEFRTMVFDQAAPSDIVEFYEDNLAALVNRIDSRELFFAMSIQQRKELIGMEVDALRKENEQLRARNESLSQAIKGLNDALRCSDPMSETDSEGCPLKHP